MPFHRLRIVITMFGTNYYEGSKIQCTIIIITNINLHIVTNKNAYEEKEYRKK